MRTFAEAATYLEEQLQALADPKVSEWFKRLSSQGYSCTIGFYPAEEYIPDWDDTPQIKDACWIVSLKKSHCKTIYKILDQWTGIPLLSALSMVELEAEWAAKRRRKASKI